MTTREIILPLALIAVLALGVAPGQAAAQDEEQAFKPGVGGPHGDGEPGEWGEWSDSGRGPGIGRRGRGRGPMGPGAPGARGLHFALRNLNLSESQAAEIRAIFEAERDQVGASHEQMRTLGAELHEQIENDPYDEESVRAKAAALASLRVEMAVMRARQVGQVRDLLTPEQLDQLEQMKDNRKAFRDERHRSFEQRRGPRSTP